MPRIQDLPGPAPAQAQAGATGEGAEDGAQELTEERKFPWSLFLCSPAQRGWGAHWREGPGQRLGPAMASALSPPRVPKPKCALPSHYHESFLEKKGPRDRVRRGREPGTAGRPGGGGTSLSLSLPTWPRTAGWVLDGPGHGSGAGKGSVHLSVCPCLRVSVSLTLI